MDRKRKFIWLPLWATLEMIDCCYPEKEKCLVLDELQKHLLSYKETESGNPITNPKLPIKVTPEFHAVLFHLMGDGNWGGKGISAGYKQKSALGREVFIQKLKNIFGEFHVNENESEKQFKVLIPSIFARIIKRYYGLHGRVSGMHNCLPPKIFESSLHSKLAGLISFIIDEGHISTTIEIYNSNKLLLEGVRALAMELGYECAAVSLKAKAGKRKEKHDHYRFRIKTNSLTKLLSDSIGLTSSYPSCNFAQKQRVLELQVQRINLKQNKRKDGETKSTLLTELKGGPNSVKQFAEKLLISAGTIREHLVELEKDDLVQRRRIQNHDEWSLPKIH